MLPVSYTVALPVRWCASHSACTLGVMLLCAAGLKMSDGVMLVADQPLSTCCLVRTVHSLLMVLCTMCMALVWSKVRTVCSREAALHVQLPAQQGDSCICGRISKVQPN